MTSIFPRAKSSCSMPSTTDHDEPSLRTGKPNWSPSGTPYSPELLTAREWKSSPGVAKCTLFTESMAAWAADAADDAPRFSMTAAPRFCTVSMNAPCSQAVSSITSGTGFPSMRGVREVGELRGRVVAPDGDVRDLAVLHAGLLRQLRLGPVLVEAGHGEPSVGGHVGSVRPGDQAVGVARVADHEDAHVGGGVVVDRLALRLEDPAVHREEVAALHARLARDRADEQRPRRAVERGLEVGGRLDADEQRVRTVLELHHHALERGQGGLDLEQPQHHRLVGTEQLTAGDPVDERVADLARGAGDGDVEGVCSHAGEITRRLPIRPKPTAWSTRSR